jgi:hypothetical protein
MMNRYSVAAIKALLLTVPLWLILAVATGEFTWKLLIVAVVLFAVVWVVLVGRAPRNYDTPPSPDEWWWNKWG